jgi:hypothetical protein
VVVVSNVYLSIYLSVLNPVPCVLGCMLLYCIRLCNMNKIYPPPHAPCDVGPSSVPCRNGVSHHSDEYASSEQIEKGIRTLAGALAKLAGSCAIDGETAPRAEREDL